MAAINGFGAPRDCRAGDALYDVGVAKVDVTPSYPIRLNGFGFRREESEGVTHPIWAKAMAIGGDQDKPLVLITLDSLGIRQSMADEVAARLATRAGIERSRVAITFSHSHTTPKVVGACDTIFSSPIPPEHQAHIDRYTQELTDALERVALEALADRQPARLQWAVGNVGFAKNRRTPGGPVDHALPMLVVRGPADDAIRAIFVTYACHCVTLSDNKISGDWAGFAQLAIEANHPGAVALVSIGCGSDSNPDSGVTGDNTAAAAGQGGQIADEVERLLGGELKAIAGETTATLNTIDLPLNPPPTREQLTTLAAEQSPAGYNAQFQLARLDRGEPLQTAIAYPVQCWTFGDSLAMVFLGGEICADYSLRLKQELDAERVWLHGYSNDFGCYVPSERLLREGGYGGGAETVYFALPNTLAPGLEQTIVDEVHRQVPPAYRPTGDAVRQSHARPKTPEESLAALKVKEGLIVEVAVADPLISDPIAIDFGLDGCLWVVDMPDYARKVDEEFEQHGSVKALYDRNGDGRFDDVQVFYEGLRFPTDVKVWRDGVIVCDAPDVIFLSDSDGDGRADVRKVLLTGFATHNAQARVNSLRWGVDNWLYGACGLFGGDIESWNGTKLKLGGQDFRFRPNTGEIQPASGKTQQGRDSDDWGNWFGCENGTLLQHYPLADHYLARNPHLAPAADAVFVPTGADANQLFPAAEPTLFHLSGPAGRPTSVCGLGIYRDELLGEGFTGNAFVGEPVNQLVHREVLSRAGVTFTGRRADDEASSEFLASTDPWFRPVQIRTGLDGCLWVVDMHRAVIEHPRWIPEETLREVDVLAGRDQGRIFRVRPQATAPRPPMPWKTLDTRGLVAALDSPNGPTRDLAQQLLVERGDAAAAPLLEELARSAERPATRLHALGTLEGQGKLAVNTVRHALADQHAEVRRHAIRLSEPFVNQSPEIAEDILRFAGDPDLNIRLQAAYTLGQWSDERAAAALAEMAAANYDSAHLLSAVWSSVNRDNVMGVFKGALGVPRRDEQTGALAPTLAKLSGRLGNAAAVREATQLLTASPPDAMATWRLDALANLLESVQGRVKDASLPSDVLKGETPQLIGMAQGAIDHAESTEAARLAAVRILAASAAESPAVIETLSDLLGPQRSPTIQQAALNVLAGVESPDAAAVLLDHWNSYTPATRSQAIDACLARPALTEALLARVKSGAIKSSHINAVERQRLLTHANAAVRTAAVEAFAGAIDANRQKIVASFAESLELPGDVARGTEVFTRHCASCHKLGDLGHSVGPDLAALSNRTGPAMLEAIFDPNRTVDERYQSYVALTADGLAVAGILDNETASSVTLHQQEGKLQSLVRADLESLQNSGVSLMPEGLEKDLTPVQVADLLAYLNASAQPSKAVDAPAAAPTGAAEVVRELAAKFTPGTPAEYEHIPAIWKASIDAAKRNDADELRELLAVSLPAIDEPLRDWQAVVIGGGVINGLTQVEVWPRVRIAEILAGDEVLAQRWSRAIELSASMADDQSVRNGTRYDALRMLGVDDFKQRGAQLKAFLAAGVDAELQWGAVGALADMDEPGSAEALIAAFDELGAENQAHAIDGLLRSGPRAALLERALAKGQLPPKSLNSEQLEKLGKLPDAADSGNDAPLRKTE